MRMLPKRHYLIMMLQLQVSLVTLVLLQLLQTRLQSFQDVVDAYNADPKSVKWLVDQLEVAWIT